MDKYFLISEQEYEGIMMTTDKLLNIQEFDTKRRCMEEIEKIKSNNSKNFYKDRILKVIKGKEIKI